ncbi:MAG: YraN family protein [Alphaproteobacteria bacterium]|nr:YraN family protein [Alphaproteobacteria bacterium]
MTGRRHAADRRGHRAESLCCWCLRLKGYRVLERRTRTPMGEIDILARRGDVLAIVEVKARPTHGQAGDAVSPRQRHRLGRAACWVLAARPELARLNVRFDAMLVAPWRLPWHLPGAWTEDG